MLADAAHGWVLDKEKDSRVQVKVLEQAEPVDKTSLDFMLGMASSLTPVSPFVPRSLGSPFVPCSLGIMPCSIIPRLCSAAMRCR